MKKRLIKKREKQAKKAEESIREFWDKQIDLSMRAAKGEIFNPHKIRSRKLKGMDGW